MIKKIHRNKVLGPRIKFDNSKAQENHQLHHLRLKSLPNIHLNKPNMSPLVISIKVTSLTTAFTPTITWHSCKETDRNIVDYKEMTNST